MGDVVAAGWPMNHCIDGVTIDRGLSSGHGGHETVPDPIAEAVAGVEHCLARAHETGRTDAVRLLHAVLALLSAAPRH